MNHNASSDGDALGVLCTTGKTARQSSLIIPSIAGLTVLMLASLGGCNRDGGQSAGPPGGGMPPPLVTTAAVITRDVPIYLDEPVGKAVATEMVTVQPQITGMLLAKHFEDGADVHKGDLLFEIDPRPFQAALDQAKATLLQNQAALQFAKQDNTRVQSLKGASAMSEEEIDQKKNAVDIAEAQVKAGEAAVETATLNIEYCRIKSPIDGRTGHRLVDPGNVVSSSGPNGGTSMLVIQKIDPIYADFTITENELPGVRQYMSQGTLKVETALPQDAQAATTQPGGQSQFQPRQGELIFLDNSVQDGTGTVKLRALLPNADHHFWPGQFVNVRLVLTVQKDAVLIPAQATQISQKGPFVYVLKSDNTAELRPIALGQRQGELVKVDRGLTAGENVIVTGQLMVMPGGKVQPAAPPPPSGGPPATQRAATASGNIHNDKSEGGRS